MAQVRQKLILARGRTRQELEEDLTARTREARERILEGEQDTAPVKDAAYLGIYEQEKQLIEGLDQGGHIGLAYPEAVIKLGLSELEDGTLEVTADVIAADTDLRMGIRLNILMGTGKDEQELGDDVLKNAEAAIAELDSMAADMDDDGIEKALLYEYLAKDGRYQNIIKALKEGKRPTADAYDYEWRWKLTKRWKLNERGAAEPILTLRAIRTRG